VDRRETHGEAEMDDDRGAALVMLMIVMDMSWPQNHPLMHHLSRRMIWTDIVFNVLSR
jgi:hypothetical protein